jgi:hypothetical protein
MDKDLFLNKNEFKKLGYYFTGAFIDKKSLQRFIKLNCKDHPFYIMTDRYVEVKGLQSIKVSVLFTRDFISVDEMIKTPGMII